MAKLVSQAINWTHDNILKYKGNPKRIFIIGHCAGGHLAALSSMSPEYRDHIIRGIILTDAAGLDMFSYLKENPPTQEDYYYVT